MLVDHLALELNGKSTGNVFCEIYKDQINNAVENYKTVVSCFSSEIQTIDEHINGKNVKGEEIKRSIRRTREFGLEAKKQFLNELRNEYGFEEYLKTLIENYKVAIRSLTNLNKLIE